MNVRSISINPDPQPTPSGARVLASFDLTLDGITMRGLSLVELSRGGFCIWSPRSTYDRMPTVNFEREARDKIVAMVQGHLADIRRFAA